MKPRLSRQPRPRVRGIANLASVLLTLVVMSILASLGVQYMVMLRETGQSIKRDQDLRVLNGAVRTYLVAGGNVEGVTTVPDVLARLKTHVPPETAESHLSYNGSVLDTRVEAVMQTPGEAAETGGRVVWNAAGGRFESAETGAAGAVEFRLDAANSSQSLPLERQRVLHASRVDKWVWGYRDTDPVRVTPTQVRVETVTNPPPAAAPTNTREYDIPPLATAWGYFLSADLSVIGIPLSTGQVGLVSRTSGTAFSESRVASGDVTLPAVVGLPLLKVLTVTSGGTANIASDVGTDTGTGGERYATATGRTTALTLDLLKTELFGFTVSPPVLSVAADVLSSTSTVSGRADHLSPAGSSVVTGLKLRVSGGPEIRVAVTGADNQTIGLDVLGLAGLEIVVNRVADGAPDVTSTHAERTALYVKASALNLGLLGLSGLVDAEIHIGRSFATMTGTW